MVIVLIHEFKSASVENQVWKSSCCDHLISEDPSFFYRLRYITEVSVKASLEKRLLLSNLTKGKSQSNLETKL